MRKLQLFFLTFLSVSALAQPVPAPMAERITVASKVLNEERSFLVRTPPGYENNSQRYPVLYMTDGDAHIAHTVTTVDFLARNGRIPQLIIVGISNTDRTRDLTPTRAGFSPARGAIDHPTSGGADNFLRFLETEVIPFVEKEYRTQPFRIFAGHSLGGLFALHTLYSRPDLFQGTIAVTPSLNWDNELPARRLAEFFKDRKELRNTLYLTIGNEGSALDQAYERLRKVFKSARARGFEYEMQKFGDEDHGSVVLPTHYAGLRKVFENWQLPRNPDNNTYAMNWTGIQKHYKDLSERLRYEVPVPEGVANLYGYQLLGSGDFRKAIEIFQWNARRYPDSANVYDSLGEAYERSGSLVEARDNYAKAAERGRQTNDPNTAVFEANLKRVAEKIAK